MDQSAHDPFLPQKPPSSNDSSLLLSFKRILLMNDTLCLLRLKDRLPEAWITGLAGLARHLSHIKSVLLIF